MNHTKLTQMLLENLPIPPQPDILVAFIKERRKNNPDVQEISKMIQNDMGLSVAILKTVNSAAFSFSFDIVSINQAVMILGLNNLSNLIFAFCLQQSSGQNSPEMKNIWEESQSVALIAAKLAQQFTTIAPDEAFAGALLSNCGAPILKVHSNEYLPFFSQHHNNATEDFIKSENETFRLDHAVVGYYFAKRWDFPMQLCHTIYHHHTTNFKNDLMHIKPKEMRTKISRIVALIQAAEYLYHASKQFPAPYSWEKNSDTIATLLSTDRSCIEEMVQVVESVMFA
ncbi:MAG: HDOD domain-containing protein [Fibrobacterales bacterium]